jgi:REP element-mobilizing transposase RayT
MGNKNKKQVIMNLEAGRHYHIYNRGNNSERIFYKDENYRYFLKKFDYYLSNFLEVYAFCLMPNHFHFLVKVKRIMEDLLGLKKDEKVPPFQKDLTGFKNIEELNLSKQHKKLVPSIREMSFFQKMTFLDAVISEQFRKFFFGLFKSYK